MGQEYFINSQELENKVKSLLPSQGGAGAGFDLSASTQIIPIVDLTESAEGSNVRQDLQTAWDFATNYTNIENSSNVSLITNTGFYKVGVQAGGTNSNASLNLFDGSTSKTIKYYAFASDATQIVETFVVFISAGISMRGTSSANTVGLNVVTRQIADINGNLTNPLNF